MINGAPARLRPARLFRARDFYTISAYAASPIAFAHPAGRGRGLYLRSRAFARRAIPDCLCTRLKQTCEPVSSHSNWVSF